MKSWQDFFWETKMSNVANVNAVWVKEPSISPTWPYQYISFVVKLKKSHRHGDKFGAATLGLQARQMEGCLYCALFGTGMSNIS